MTSPPQQTLARVVGVPGAVLLGLGSILGTGIFVSVGIAAGVAGPTVVLAAALAAVVATFNGLSSAELAASHPVSGGTDVNQFPGGDVNNIHGRTVDVPRRRTGRTGLPRGGSFCRLQRHGNPWEFLRKRGFVADAGSGQ